MKNESTPIHNPGTPVPRHQFEHATPTVIHDPEEDMMLLARWVHRAMKDPGRFWGWVIGVCAATLGLVVLVNLFSTRGGGQSDVWTRLDEARNADEKLEIAKSAPDSPAAPWARLQAASQLYQSGVSDLPGNSDTALQSLKKAVDLFDQIAKSEPKDSPVAVAAAFGLARALEARNELPKAVDQYKLVAETWPDSPEASEAKKLAVALQKPEAANFYKELYAYKKTEVSLPPLGTEKLEFPPVVPAPGDSSGTDTLLIPPPPPSAGTPKPEEPKSEEPKAEARESEAAKVEAPKTEAPKAETPPAEAPKAEASKP